MVLIKIQWEYHLRSRTANVSTMFNCVTHYSTGAAFQRSAAEHLALLHSIGAMVAVALHLPQVILPEDVRDKLVQTCEPALRTASQRDTCDDTNRIYVLGSRQRAKFISGFLRSRLLICILT